MLDNFVIEHLFDDVAKTSYFIVDGGVIFKFELLKADKKNEYFWKVYILNNDMTWDLQFIDEESLLQGDLNKSEICSG